ncbi:MAG: hypothetical protein MSC30_15005 [Gaiellaceae bacterium MAG52_C11]|nr:hypothetical protein [Candidatus Gaiellasilicea maunaloa]
MSRAAIAAGGWAAVLSGAPTTVYALAAGRDPLEATKAAGAILLPRSTRTLPLLLAAVPVHLAVSLGWAVALDRVRVRGAARGAAAGLGIAALDLGVLGLGFPRLRALALGPQILDHLAYGVVVGVVLSRARRRDSVR